MTAISGSALTKGHDMHLHQAFLPRDPRTLGVQVSAPWRTPSQQTARSLAIGRFHQCTAAVIGSEPARISNLRVESRGLTFTLPVDHAQVHAEWTALQCPQRDLSYSSLSINQPVACIICDSNRASSHGPMTIAHHSSLCTVAAWPAGAGCMAGQPGECGVYRAVRRQAGRGIQRSRLCRPPAAARRGAPAHRHR
jgi:hypothetical protein